jgi:cystathionine beta-lyase/cystathionine gamma-synthase
MENRLRSQGLGKNARLILNQTSLGDPVSRIVARNEEKDRGLPPRHSRLSIGLEDPSDLIAHPKQAIGKCVS